MKATASLPATHGGPMIGAMERWCGGAVAVRNLCGSYGFLHMWEQSEPRLSYGSGMQRRDFQMVREHLVQLCPSI